MQSLLANKRVGNFGNSHSSRTWLSRPTCLGWAGVAGMTRSPPTQSLILQQTIEAGPPGSENSVGKLKPSRRLCRERACPIFTTSCRSKQVARPAQIQRMRQHSSSCGRSRREPGPCFLSTFMPGKPPAPTGITSCDPVFFSDPDAQDEPR